MGVVYKATDLKLDRPVALKFLSLHLQADDYNNRFLMEARSASTLDHPNICTIYEFNETEDGQMFIAMAYYEGQTLSEKLRQGPLPAAEGVSVVDQILQGLSKAHERGIVHRDIKPANVIITRDGLAKILDFGLAKLVGQLGITASGVAVGTAYYMSPEQVNGKSVDHRSDIWSAGVVLYETLTGILPFQGDSPQAILHSVLNKDFEPVTKIRYGTPAGLDRILNRALSKNPDTRYPSALEMSRDLRKLGAEFQQQESAPTMDTPVAALQPEKMDRKHLTILTGQIFGHAELVEQLPPGETETVLQQIQDITTKTVEEHGGVLNRFAGESLVCLFGIPRGREDDSLRAVRCALDLHCRIRELGMCIEPRIGETIRLMSGISAGLVVTEPLSGSEIKYRTTGDAVQIAARLAAESEPDEILVSAELQRALAPYFDMESCPALPLKGKAQTVTPYSVKKETGYSTRLDASKHSGLTPFTGRSEHLVTLENCLDAVCRGEGHFVGITGEAGIGKSRLMHEFDSLIQERQLHICIGRCQPGRTGLSNAPFTGALKDLLQFHEQEGGPDSADEIIKRILAIDPSLSDFLPMYLYLFAAKHPDYSLPGHLQGEDLCLAIGEAMSAIFAISSQRRPVVLFLEDWHGSDEAARSVLKQLTDILPSYRILVIAAYRPELGGDPQSAVQTIIRLEPMDAALSRSVLCSVLNVDQVSEDAASLILEKTGGNPFFIEEVCCSLLEEGIITVANRTASLRDAPAQFRLPDTVEAVIRTRLDRLETHDKEVLRIAAVVGREFSRNQLQRIAPSDYPVPQALENLKSMGLIRQISVLPEARYRFKHVLTQQVAYESLLHHRRKSLHALAAQVTEEIYSARIDEVADQLMHHFSQAEEWGPAIHYAMLAEQRLKKLGQYAETLEVLQKVAAWLMKLSHDSQWQQKLVENLLNQERLCETLGLREKQMQLIAELERILESAPDPSRLTEVYCRKGDVHTLLGRFDAAEESFANALRISREAGGRVEERNALRSLAYLRWRQGRYQEAAEINRNVLAIDRMLNDEQSIAVDLGNLSNTYRHMGEFNSALESIQEAMEIYSRNPDPLKESTALHFMSSYYRDLGDLEKALHYIRRAQENGVKNHLLLNQSFHLSALGNLLWQLGKAEESLAAFKEAVEVNRKTRHADGLAQSLRGVGDILMAQGNQKEALPYFVESAPWFESLGDVQAELHVRTAAAGILEGAGEVGQALRHWERVRTIQASLEDSKGEVLALEAMARLSRIQGAPQQVTLEYYAGALKIVEKGEDAAKAAALLNSMGILEWSLRRFESALSSYGRALEIFRKIGDPVHEGFILNSIGVTLNQMGKEEEAIGKLEEAAVLNRQNREYLLEGHSRAALGEAWYKKGVLPKAMECYEESLRIRRQIGDRNGEGWMLYHLGRILAAQAEMGRAKDSLALALRVAQEVGDEALKHSSEEILIKCDGGADA